MLAAIRRVSSRVREVPRRAASRLILEVDVGERLPVGVADNETPPIQLGVGFTAGRFSSPIQGGGKLCGLHRIKHQIEYRPISDGTRLLYRRDCRRRRPTQRSV